MAPHRLTLRKALLSWFGLSSIPNAELPAPLASALKETFSPPTALKNVDQSWAALRTRIAQSGSEPTSASLPALSGVMRRRRRRLALTTALPAAAVMTLLLLPRAPQPETLLWMESGSAALPAPATTIVSGNAGKMLTLADDARISMAAGTQISGLRASLQAGRKTARLDLDQGSLSLEIKPEVFASFAVIAGDWRVTVTGTVFTLTRTSEELRIAVASGSVAASSGNASTTVRAGQAVSCTGSGIITQLTDEAPQKTATPADSLSNAPATNQPVIKPVHKVAGTRDRLTLKDGTVLVGSISMQDASHISIQTEYGAHLIPRKEVVRIDVLP